MFVMVDEELDISLEDGKVVRADERKYCNVEADLGELSLMIILFLTTNHSN